MHAAPPKLRSDLTVSRQPGRDGGEKVCVVKDLRTGRFFQFGELEQFIAEQLDGATPLEVVRHRTEARFDASLPGDALAAFVRSLEKGGLLEGSEAPRVDRRRLRGSLLYLRYRLFDPDRLFDYLLPRLRFCFTRPFLLLSGSLMLLATGIAIFNWGDIAQDLSRLRLSSIPLFLLVSIGLASAHEFAHGLTCKRFGGAVHELGFLLMYFTPSFYTNVSDAWLFPEKAKRLWVGFAGPYVELLLWALATLAWRVTDVDTRLNYAALIVMTLSGVKTLFNLNPFIKLDGYYLLSDYLELPNLRKRAFRHVGSLLKRAAGLGGRTKPTGNLSQRERWVYLAYGLLGSIASLSILAYVVVTAGAYLIDTHQSMALLLFTGLATTTSRRKLRRLFGRGARAPDAGDDDGEADVGNRSDGNGGGASPRAAAAPLLRWSGPVKLAVLGAAAVSVLCLVRLQLRIGGPVAILPEENAEVRAQVDGIVEEILVDEGDAVRTGDVIARLSNHAMEAELLKTVASVRDTRAQLRKAEAGPTTEEITLNEVAVSRVQDRLRVARDNLARLTRLFETQAITRQELEAAQQQVRVAEHDVDDAQGRLALLKGRVRPEDLESARAKLGALEAQQRFLDGEVRELVVRSPATGIVATPSRQLREMRGQLVARGALIARVYDFRTVRAQLVVSEKEIADVRVGHPVALRVRGYPDVAFRGTVTAIATEGTVGTSAAGAAGGGSTSSPLASSSNTTRSFVVTTRIDNRLGLLKPGMTGQGKIYAGERRIIGLISRRLARTFKVEFWSWW